METFLILIVRNLLMNMLQYSLFCKKRARQLAKAQPGLIHTKALDLAASQLGFQHYTALNKLHKLLGDDGVPSQLSIAMAGGDPRQSPLEPISTSVSIGWSSAHSVDH